MPKTEQWSPGRLFRCHLLVPKHRQSLGDCQNLELQRKTAEATKNGFGAHFHRSQHFCHLQQVWLALCLGFLGGAGR